MIDHHHLYRCKTCFTAFECKDCRDEHERHCRHPIQVGWPDDVHGGHIQ